MSGAPPKGRPPVAFSLDDPPPSPKEAPAAKPVPKPAPKPVSIAAPGVAAPVESAPKVEAAPKPEAAPRGEAPARETAYAPAESAPRESSAIPEIIRIGRSWGSIFLSAVGGLIFLAFLVWVQDTFLSLLSRKDWLGLAATLLLAIAVFAFVMILAREIAGLYRLSAIAAVRRRADAALAAENVSEARSASAEIRAMLEERRELADGVARLKRHQGDILDARQVLTLTERELLSPLDRLARSTVGNSGRRVSMVTALSPAAVFAVGFVAYENFRMLRNLAGVYGGRPGFMSVLRLMRLIAAHLALTGGIAFTDDILGQFLGHGVTSRVSKRLGEGLVNGGFTIRIGIAAIEVLRPLPYIEARQPRLREFVSEFLKVGQKPDTNNGKERA
ncbi:MAG TPA: TIGR01620 family protein [Rhodomicrobium sp.]|nr:TIGR01620 family protein [Rhodomicrobium sp.]